MTKVLVRIKRVGMLCPFLDGLRKIIKMAKSFKSNHFKQPPDKDEAASNE